MITSIHMLIYSDDANATRAFLRDVLGWKYVAEDFDNDWLIFKSGPRELGVHPTHSEWEGKSYDYPRHHSIALMCDDVDATVDKLRARGAQFRGPIEQREYGRVKTWRCYARMTSNCTSQLTSWRTTSRATQLSHSPCVPVAVRNGTNWLHCSAQPTTFRTQLYRNRSKASRRSVSISRCLSNITTLRT